jgi:hypothetical protein
VSSQWVDWLLSDGAWWLWSSGTQRETMRLLVLRGARISDESRATLEVGILQGPPRAMFPDDIEPGRWSEFAERAVWLRLSKLASSGASLGDEARFRLEALSAAHPMWKLAKNESDEFSFWMSGTGDPDANEWRRFESVPRRSRELMEWLVRPPSNDPWNENDWRQVCREKFSIAARALFVLACRGQWPVERWREALQVWREEDYLRRSWRYLAPTLQRMPDHVLLAIAHSVSTWLEAAAKIVEGHEVVLIEVCRRLLLMDHGDQMEAHEPVMGAINHPIGQLTQALLHLWFRREPQDRQGLPNDLRPIFTELCGSAAEQYRHARVILAAHAIALYRVDFDWATLYLLPLFDWRTSNVEARGAWEGFLWSPRLYRPLFVAFKLAFLETARHYTELREHGSHYAAILTYAALDPADTFTIAEVREATQALPPDGLNEVADTLVHSLEGSGEQRQAYWTNRVHPYWQRVWPQSREFASKRIAEQLARLSIAAGSAFPQALAAVHSWLQPVDHPFYIIHLLHESGLCTEFPQESLKLLAAIIENQQWPPPELRACLDAIAQKWPDSLGDAVYQRLMEYARRKE